MATVVGARDTSNITASIRKIDMVKTIKELEPSATPLTLLSTRLPSEDATDPMFSWMEDDLPPRFDAINNGAGYTNSATSIVVDNGAYFQLQELWKVTRTAEIVRVTAISTNTLTVTRGIGGGAAAILDNDELYKLSSAHQENALSGIAQSRNPTKVTNYTQIVRDWVEASETLRHSANETSPMDWDRMVAKKMIEHKLKLEAIFKHGKPSEDLTSAPLRTSGGAYHFVQTNRIDMGGAMTQAEFFGAFSTAFRYGNADAKVGFASRLATGVVNGYPMANIRVVQGDGDNAYGLSVMRYVSPFGTLRIVTDNSMEGAVYGGHILILDMDQLKKRPLQGRDTHLNEHIEPNDQDGRKDEILTEIGMQFGLEKTHTILTGITS